MGEGVRNKTNQPSAASSSHRVHGAGVRSFQEDEANVETLVNVITNLMATVSNMSLRLDGISSSVNGLVNNSKNVEAASGKLTVAEPVRLSSDSLDDPDFRGFYNFKQTTNVAEYQEKFEELKDLMLKRNHLLTEDYLVSCFLSGLKSVIKNSIGDPKPESINHAFDLARDMEKAIQEMKDGVMIDGLREDNLQCEKVTVFNHRDDPSRFGALVGEMEIKVLICPEVAYSLVDTSLAITAAWKIEKAEPLRVLFLMLHYSAVSRFRCPNFEWTMQGKKFSAEMRIVEIKAKYNIVLGSDWVRENNSLSLSSDRIFLEKEGKEIVLLDLSQEYERRLNGSAETGAVGALRSAGKR